MTSLKRLEADNLRRLEEMRSKFDRLRAERIRAEGEVERLTRELDQARDIARAEFGTDDEAHIELQIEAALTENARRLEEFDTVLREVEMRLQQLGGDR